MKQILKSLQNRNNGRLVFGGFDLSAIDRVESKNYSLQKQEEPLLNKIAIENKGYCWRCSYGQNYESYLGQARTSAVLFLQRAVDKAGIDTAA